LQKDSNKSAISVLNHSICIVSLKIQLLLPFCTIITMIDNGAKYYDKHLL